MFKQRQIFIDFDDTLIDDNYKFEVTACDCVKVIVQAFETQSPPIDEIINQFQRVDDERLKSVPAEERFNPSRLTGSWHECYDYLCEKYGITRKRSTHMLLEGYAMQNFDPPYYVIPNVINILNELVKFGRYDLRLITVGSEEVQRRKLAVTELEKYFASLHITPNGDKMPILEKAAKEFGQPNVWMVGNSIRSDVNPALQAGVNAIYIPRGSWHMWRAEPLNKKFTEINQLFSFPILLNAGNRHQIEPAGCNPIFYSR